MMNRGIVMFWIMKVSQRSEMTPPKSQPETTFGPDCSPRVYEVVVANGKTHAGVDTLTLMVRWKPTRMTLTKMLFTVTAILDSISYLDKNTTK